jgi:general stress protein 26
MSRVPAADRAAFFRAVDAASRKAVWAAIATVEAGAPRVRLVHPTWEGETLWFATGSASPKVRQLGADPRVDLQYQVAPPDFVHVLVRGRAALVAAAAEKARVWDVIDYDLGQFWPGGPTDPGYALVRIEPERVELSELFGTRNRRVWTRG